jgi:hypothetical protein
MKTLQLAMLVIALALMSFSAHAAETHNMTTEFSASSNPNDVWTYGHYGDEGSGSLDKSTFQPFTLQSGLPADLSGLGQCDGSSGYLEGWRDETDPNVLRNTGATTFCGGFSGITFHAGAVTFGPYRGPAVVRYTVPSAGDWQVDATFATVQDGNGPPAAYVHDGVSGDTTFDLVSGSVSAFPATDGYSQLLTGLPAGAKIDIVVWGNDTNNKTTEVSAIITKANLNVGIDIKPGSDPNSINLCSAGAVPVAILGSGTFDVHEVDTATLRFADAGVKVVGKKDKELCSYEDANGDGIDDLICHFVTMDISAIDGASLSATVNGTLIDGTEIDGMDSVNIVKDTCN